MVRFKAQKIGIYIFYSEKCDEEVEHRKGKTLKEIFDLISKEPEELGIAREAITQVCIERKLSCKLLFELIFAITTNLLSFRRN